MSFTREGLARLDACMARHVAEGRVPGVVTLLDRKGETHVAAHGALSFGGAPMKADAVFRIASMTKPVTAVAAMILVEEGVLHLDEPVDELLPELADMRVLRTPESEVDDTVAAARSITLRDLLTFRLGTGAVMEMPGTFPIQRAMAAVGLEDGPELPAMDADTYMKRLGALPLIHQPGARWMYHTGADVLGVLIARATGGTLGDFMRARIFGPLGMADTGFAIPRDQLHRLPTAYASDHETGGVKVWDGVEDSLWIAPKFESGGGGLVSTAADYLKFCRMMLGRGRLGDERVLSRPSVLTMTSDQITPAQRAGADIFFGDSASWGFGMAVVARRGDVFATPGRFGWDGGYGTSGHSDPAEDMAGIYLTQRLMDSPQPPRPYLDFWTMAYAAIAD